MKQPLQLLFVATIFISTIPFASADNMVRVGGTTYRCDNVCSVDTSTNPPTVTDCCGGSVWIRQQIK